MKLPPGATGFDPPSDQHPATTDLRTFVAACHHGARRTGGTVTGTTPAGVTPSFHTVDIHYANHEVAVLRHVLLPYVAFASPRTDGRLTMAFID
ncbi:MAG: hypothetical protein QOG10_371 [Kribbellaceae bacterium]|jgi:hypothetical protein|nr:hypothetical protein [Kribbellaceae bacterium]